MFIWLNVERLVIFDLQRERGYSVCYTSHFCLIVFDYSNTFHVYTNANIISKKKNTKDNYKYFCYMVLRGMLPYYMNTMAIA